MTRHEEKFIKIVWDYYSRQGRRSLPWRLTKNPYHILVSEIMLQQTQVDRVIPKYQSFLKRFPSLASLASAPLGEVLREWQGLGYNRRAKMLHECAKIITYKFRGRTPKSYSELIKLPGIGRYTAGALMAFAWNEPVPIIETNIRSVYLQYFFNDKTDVSDKEIIRVIERTLNHEKPREWYYALMDYGVYIKKEFGNQNSRGKHYAKQSAFKGSDRQIRGAILKLLMQSTLTRMQFFKKLPFEDVRIDAQLERLLKEGMIVQNVTRYQLPR